MVLWWEVVAGVVGAFVGCVVLFLLLKLYIKCTMGKVRSQRRMDGKVVIITGANSGIGKEAAREIAKRGAKVILACRNTEKGKEAADEILQDCPTALVQVKKLDLCSLKSVRQFADEIMREESKLDVLLNNAGLSGGREVVMTEDGFEQVYQANYIGPFLLTELLLNLIKKSTPARIVLTGSSTYIAGRVDPNNFDKDSRSTNNYRYAQTKLAMIMWAKELGHRLKETGVTVNVCHPGVVRTPLAHKDTLTLTNAIFRMSTFTVGRNTVEGAQTLIHLCVDENIDNITGKYFEECKPKSVFKGNNMEDNSKFYDATRHTLMLTTPLPNN